MLIKRKMGDGMNILVTAFDAFGGDTRNISQEVIECLPNSIGTCQIHKLIVPTVFGESGDRVISAMDQFHPDIVLCLGQARDISTIELERIAINLMDARIPDNAGYQPDEVPVIANAPAAYFSTLPVKKMMSVIQADHIPVSISNSAGTYVCNQLLYRVLHHATIKMPHVRACFIHLPAPTEDGISPITRKQMTFAVKTAIKSIGIIK